MMPLQITYYNLYQVSNDKLGLREAPSYIDRIISTVNSFSSIDEVATISITDKAVLTRDTSAESNRG